VRDLQGRLIGRMEGLGFELREEAVLETLTEDIVKTSEIEGEFLNPDEVVCIALLLENGGRMIRVQYRLYQAPWDDKRCITWPLKLNDLKPK
jgi:hypothetical protein